MPHHDMTHNAANFITNHPHQHAFVLLGKQTVFAVHMTQYHHEEHKYQLVLKISLPPDAKYVLDGLRAQFPADTFILCNGDSDHDLFMIPELPAGRRQTFNGNIFQGLPAFSPEDEANPHFFPWNKAHTIPVVADVKVTVERIVTFRPFAHHLQQPEFATYLLWGEGAEAHMTNLQTARLASGKFEPAMFGPDYDHALSLREAPAWLDKPLLEAGIVVSVPALRLRDKKSGKPTIPCGVPFKMGDALTVLYRGMGEGRVVTAGHSYLADTAVCNSEGMDVCPPESSLVISATPGGLMR